MIENIRNIFCLWYRAGMPISAGKMSEIGTYAVFHGTEGLDRFYVQEERTVTSL